MGGHGQSTPSAPIEQRLEVDQCRRQAGHACLSTVDLLPRLGAMLRLLLPDHLEGMDLSHCVYGQAGSEPDAALMQICGATAAWEDGHEWRALRDKQYTYAIYRVDGKELLFDNRTDPYQQQNLVGDPVHAPVLARFRATLRHKMAALNDAFEACTWYRDHWTDGRRNIVRSATSDFGA